MFAKCRLFVLGLSLVFKFYVSGDFAENLDDLLGNKYIAKEDVDQARRQIESYHEGFGTDWTLMSDENGTCRIVLFKKGSETSRDSDNRLRLLVDNTSVEESVHFFLFTKGNPTEGERLYPRDLQSSKFDASKPTKIIIHGWQSSGSSEIVTSIRDAYLSNSDVNVIGVNWSGPASNMYYPTSADYTKKVGSYVAELIDNLVQNKGAKHEDFHIIGHSLGAHTAGVAGHTTKQKISRITGLDPALPCFQNVKESEYRLDESDANFVEGIHTCAGALGMSSPVGHVDFYPNGGSPFQPGCCCNDFHIYSCSHGRSYLYFAESIGSKEAFEGVKCSTWASFKGNSCEDITIPMGEFTPTSSRGVFYLLTSSESPFGLGDLGTTFH